MKKRRKLCFKTTSTEVIDSASKSVTLAKTKNHPIGWFFVLLAFGKAGVGFEPHGFCRANRARGGGAQQRTHRAFKF